MFALATLPAIFVGGPFGIAIEEAGRLVTPVATTKLSRHFEGEADYLGIEYMYLAGYDPQAFISLFERLQKLERDKPRTLAKVFAMHPQTADRTRKIQSEIARILPSRELYTMSTSEFDEVKQRLAAISSQPDREQPAARPTLRRRIVVERDGSGSANESSALKREDIK
jgi:predicted Zn-dependent protease